MRNIARFLNPLESILTQISTSRFSCYLCDVHFCPECVESSATVAKVEDRTLNDEKIQNCKTEDVTKCVENCQNLLSNETDSLHKVSPSASEIHFGENKENTNAFKILGKVL